MCAKADAGSYDYKRENAEVMAYLRQGSAAALQLRIEKGELLTFEAFEKLLGEPIASIKDAQLLAQQVPSGAMFYPAFYADPSLDRAALDAVLNVLRVVRASRVIPSASVYFFFTSRWTSLGATTPLDALRHGRLDEVLDSAAAFADL